MVQIVVTLPELSTILGEFSGMAGRMTNQRPLLDEARQAAEEGFADAFRNEGPGWAARRPLTDLKRGGQGTGSGPILNESGTLAGSYLKGGTDHYEQWGADFVETGSALKYAVPHEEGFSNRGTVPKTSENRPVKMRGQRVVSRSVFKNVESMERRIVDRYEAAVWKALNL